MIYTAKGAKSKTHKSARVTTNDTTLGNVTISFRAEVKEPTDSILKITAVPPMLDFGPVEKKKRRKLESKITNTTDEELQLAIVSAPPTLFKKVELSRSRLKPGESAKLKVELIKGQEDQKFRKSVTLQAIPKDGKKFRLTVPLVKGIGDKATAKKDTKDTKGQKGKK